MVKTKSTVKKFITSSSKNVTVMFTDIVDSTRYWDAEGDVNGRLMVDQHNQLVFPVIRKFKGKIIKTIGDSVMASFKSPDKAMRAAIGIQQSLAAHREENENFNLKIRIGMHSGEALIERNDVFGDTVNVAARVESEADADEILVSSYTKEQVGDKVDFRLSKKTSFVPKGKSEKIDVYKCDWQKIPSQIEGINFDTILPLMTNHKNEILIQLAVVFAFLYYIIQNYLRYVLADQEYVYLLSFSPQQMTINHPYITTGLIITAFAMVRVLKYLTVVPILPFRMLKAAFGYAVTFAITLLALNLLPAEYTYNSQQTFKESKHLFVKVLQPDANIRDEPSLKSRVIAQANEGDLFLLADVAKSKKLVWNKVLIGIDEYGWIARSIPPSFGVEEKRLTITNKYSMKYMDIYAFLGGILGFIWGLLSFSVRPL